MTLEIELKHNLLANYHLCLDSMYIYTKQQKEPLFLDWDESIWSYQDNFTSGRCKGVYINDEYANGRINLLEDITEIELNLDIDENADCGLEIQTKIKRLLFSDNDKTLGYGYPKVK